MTVYTTNLREPWFSLTKLKKVDGRLNKGYFLLK